MQAHIRRVATGSCTSGRLPATVDGGLAAVFPCLVAALPTLSLAPWFPGLSNSALVLSFPLLPLPPLLPLLPSPSRQRVLLSLHPHGLKIRLVPAFLNSQRQSLGRWKFRPERTSTGGRCALTLPGRFVIQVTLVGAEGSCGHASLLAVGGYARRRVRLDVYLIPAWAGGPNGSNPKVI